MYTAQDWENYLIVRNRKDDTVLTRGNLNGVKPEMIELDRKISHNSGMSIIEFFIDRDERSHLVDQVIPDIEGIGDTSVEGANRMGQLFTAALSVNGYAVI